MLEKCNETIKAQFRKKQIKGDRRGKEAMRRRENEKHRFGSVSRQIHIFSIVGSGSVFSYWSDQENTSIQATPNRGKNIMLLISFLIK